MLKPFDTGLNVAVLQIASQLFPTGYDVGPEAPDTLQKLTAHISATGRMLVWNGESDATIFGDPEVNWAFRAWHDWAHWAGQFPFDLAGETKAAELQVFHLVKLYGATDRVVGWASLILAEVIGQAFAFDRTGEFPKDQRAFTRHVAPSYRRRAQELVESFAADLSKAKLAA